MDNLSCYNTRFAEERFDDFLDDPESLPDSWHEFFDELDQETVAGRRGQTPHPRRSVFDPVSSIDGQFEAMHLQDRVNELITSYRVRGHLAAKLDPLGLARPEPSELSLESCGIQEHDLKRCCSTFGLGGSEMQTVEAIVHQLHNIYCRHIGVQFMHIDDVTVRKWLQQRMEGTGNHIELSRQEQLRILSRLTDAEVFEEFVRKKYIGAKTFSLAGAESLIPLLDLAFEKAGTQGIEEIVLGMAHRGRLNVLANIIGKRPQEIFWEFNDPRPELHSGSGDVKYHLGFSGNWKTLSGHEIHLSLCFNPSHLEFVNPVALGRTRAKQDHTSDRQRKRGMVLLIHGDAGFAGEGIVQESLNLSQLDGYTTGGALHVILNNQLGFTTPSAKGSSATYPTDVARMLQTPIFHVNGEHPEAVAQAVELAMDFRAKFHRDVVIDMFCYRRWGHNEGDEPSFTQPLMYKAIEQRDSVREGYLEHLLTLGEVTRNDAEVIAKERREELGRHFRQAKKEEYIPTPHSLSGVWEGYVDGVEPEEDDPKTGVDQELLARLLFRMTEVPEDFHVHNKLKRSMEHRRKMAEGEEPLNWSAAEALAIASLAVEGHPVRLSGQDTARGTFSQRHAVLHDVVDGDRWSIFEHLSDDQAPVGVINSPLCEAGALGFEYGYSLDYPQALVAWEAQFGDFANAAQVITDQFLTSAEDKWRRLSGLVLLLPHGFEGMGPEHSSARLERFLSLSAEDNIQVVCPTTPAQYFHVLRRQVKRRWRKPLVVFTPKSLLRRRHVKSTLEELEVSQFQRVLSDERIAEPSRVLMCGGKVYYDLLNHRESRERDDVAILRVEQFYPLRDEVLHAALEPYPEETPIAWIQEEPLNMGGAPHWRRRFGNRILGHPFCVVARPESASPATGSKASHKREQEELLTRAFQEKSKAT